MDNFIKQYMALVNGVKLVSLFALIFLDAVLGIAVAIAEKKFNWHRLADFVDTSVFTLAGGYLIVGVFAVIEPQYSFAVLATWGLIDAKLVADIVTKLRALGMAIKAYALSTPSSPAGTSGATPS